MTSLRTRSRKDGTTYHAVQYRHGGKQSSTSFEDLATATSFRNLVDVIGPAKAWASVTTDPALSTAGAVDINDVMIHGFSFALPMGGWKHSGIGLRNGGAAGLLKYCRPQAITAPRMPTLSAELLWYPYSRRKFRLAMGAVRAAAAHGLRRVGLKPRGGAR